MKATRRDIEFYQENMDRLQSEKDREAARAAFMQKDASDQFEKDLRYSVNCLHKHLWFAIRDDHSFNSAGRIEITHGGTHLFECIIPFIKF